MSRRFALSLPLIFLLGGCSVLQPLGETGSRLARYQVEVEQQHYGAALTLIENTDESHPDHPALQARLKQLKSAIRHYEEQTISAALKLERQNHWQQAEERLKQARSQLPKSPPLQTAQAEFEQRREQRIDKLRREQLIVRGAWLTQELPLRRGLLQTSPGNLLRRWELQRLENEIRDVATSLREHGETAMTAGQLALALRTLPLAVELDPSEANRAAHSKLKQRLAKRNQRKVLEAERKLRDRQRIWIDQLNQALAADNLHRAQELYNLLKREAPLPENFDLIEEQLELVLSHHVEQELLVGDIYYRSGDYKLAQETWERVLAIHPDNDLAVAKLERVNRVIDKLEQLRKRQQQRPASPVPAED